MTFCQDCLDLHQTFCQDGCVSDILSGGHFVRTGWICTRQIVRMCMLTRVYFWYIGHISGMFMTKFHNFDQISQFQPNFAIKNKFHNFDQISQFLPNFTTFTKFHNFNHISRFRWKSNLVRELVTVVG